MTDATLMSIEELPEVLSEMENERKSCVDKIASWPHADKAGLKLLSELCNVCMGTFTHVIRLREGGLMPYDVAYGFSQDGQPSPEDGHMLRMSYKKDDGELIKIAVITIAKLSENPSWTGPELPPSEFFEDSRATLHRIMDDYETFVENSHIDNDSAAILFYTPLMAALCYLSGAAEVSLGDQMLEPPMRRAGAEAYFPFEFDFNSDNPGDRHICIRAIQPIGIGEVYAVEFFLDMDNVLVATAHERAYWESLQDKASPTLH